MLPPARGSAAPASIRSTQRAARHDVNARRRIPPQSINLGLNVKKILICAAFISTVFVSGCASSIYRTPGAEGQAIGQLAVVEYNGELGAYGVNILKVDGKRRGIGFFRRYELSSGEHSMTIDLNIPGANSQLVTLNFIAVAGRTYEVKYEIHKTGILQGSWRVWIEDKESGARIDSGEG